jgi:hypothetical protein
MHIRRYDMHKGTEKKGYRSTETMERKVEY